MVHERKSNSFLFSLSTGWSLQMQLSCVIVVSHSNGGVMRKILSLFLLIPGATAPVENRHTCGGCPVCLPPPRELRIKGEEEGEEEDDDDDDDDDGDKKNS